MCSRTRKWLAIVVVVATAIRVVTLVGAMGDPAFSLTRFDELAFLERAGLLADTTAGGQALSSAMPVSPGYVAFVAIVGRLHAMPVLAIGVANLLLGVSTTIATFLLARRFSRPAFAAAASLVLATNAPMLYAETRPCCDVLVTSSLAWAAWAWTAWSEDPKTRHAALGSSFFAVAVAARASTLVALPLLLWMIARRRRRCVSTAWRSAVLLVAATVVVMGASFRYNADRGDPTPFAATGPINAWIGNGPGATGTWHRPQGFHPGPRTDDLMTEMVRVAGLEAGRALRPDEARAVYTKKTLLHLVSNPVSTLRLWITKARLVLERVELGDNRDYYLERSVHPLLRRNLLPDCAPLTSLGVAALVWLARRRRSAPLVILGLVVPLATMLGFYVLGRYRLALLPSLTVALALGAEVVARSRTRKRVGRVVPVLAAAAALAFVAVGRPSIPAPRAPARLARGVDLHRVRRLDLAVPEYEAALRIAATSGDVDAEAEILSNLGLAKLDLRDRDGALATYEDLDRVLLRGRREVDRERLRVWMRAQGLEP